MPADELRSKNKTIKRTNAASGKKGSFISPSWSATFEFHCNSIAYYTLHGLKLHLHAHIHWALASGVQALRAWFCDCTSLSFVCSSHLFFCLSLERIKLCGLHQRRMLYGAFWCTTGSLSPLMSTKYIHSFLADFLLQFTIAVTFLCSTLYSFHSWFSVMFVFNNVRFQ